MCNYLDLNFESTTASVNEVCADGQESDVIL